MNFKSVLYLQFFLIISCVNNVDVSLKKETLKNLETSNRFLNNDINYGESYLDHYLNTNLDSVKILLLTNNIKAMNDTINFFKNRIYEQSNKKIIEGELVYNEKVVVKKERVGIDSLYTITQNYSNLLNSILLDLKVPFQGKDSILMINENLQAIDYLIYIENIKFTLNRKVFFILDSYYANKGLYIGYVDTRNRYKIIK